MGKYLYYINISLFIVLSVMIINGLLHSDNDITSNSVLDLNQNACTMSSNNNSISNPLNINLCCQVIKKNCIYDFKDSINYQCNTTKWNYKINRKLFINECLN